MFKYISINTKRVLIRYDILNLGIIRLLNLLSTMTIRKTIIINLKK